MSREDHSNSSASADSRSEQAQPTTTSVGGKLEELLADLLGIISRYVRTVALLSFMPARAGHSLCLQPPDYQYVLRPYTLLLIGCLLYSFPLGAVNYLSSSQITHFVADIAKETLATEFSLTALLIRSLPIIIITSLSATLAGMLMRASSDIVRTVMVYLYGLQGSVLFFIVLSMDAMGDASQMILGSDDPAYIMLPPLIVLALHSGLSDVSVCDQCN